MPVDKQYPMKQLRHTFCSALLMLDVPIDRVCDIMCHSSVEVTRRYARALGKQKSKDLVKLAEAYHSGELHQMQKVLTEEDRFALLSASQQIRIQGMKAEVATDPQFQHDSLYNKDVLASADARKPFADVAELVDAHV